MPDRSKPITQRPTIADLALAVVGVALGFTIEPVRAEVTRVVQVCGWYWPVVAYQSLFWTAVRFVMPLFLGLVLVEAGRIVRANELPRAGDWLSLILLLFLLDTSLPRGDVESGPIASRAVSYQRTSDGVWVGDRYVASTVFTRLEPDQSLPMALGTTVTMALAIGVGARMVIQATRGSIPGWLAFGIGAFVGWLCLRNLVPLNPVAFTRSRFSWTGPTRVMLPVGWSAGAFEWHVEARLALGRWPFALIVALPAFATIRDSIRSAGSQGRWTEGCGMTLCALLALAWAVDELALRPAPATMIRVTVFLIFAGAVALSGWIGLWVSDRVFAIPAAGPRSARFQPSLVAR